MTKTVINSDVANYAALVEAVRSADVTSTGKATLLARSSLSRLAVLNEAGKQLFTTESMIAAVCAVYKPVTAKGKRSDTIGALRASGWHAMAKQLTDIQYIDKNIAIEGVKPLVDAFCASDKAKDSFNALNVAVKEAVTGSAKLAKAEAEAKASEGEGEGEGEGSEGQEGEGPSPIKASVADTIALFTTWFNNMNHADLLAMTGEAEQAALLAMSDAMNAANDKAFAMSEARSDIVAQLAA